MLWPFNAHCEATWNFKLHISFVKHHIAELVNVLEAIIQRILLHAAKRKWQYWYTTLIIKITVIPIPYHIPFRSSYVANLAAGLKKTLKMNVTIWRRICAKTSHVAKLAAGFKRSLIIVFSWAPNTFLEKFSSTCCLANFPIISAFWGSCSNNIIADAKLSGVGSHRNPVAACFTLSLGPPLLHATTGFSAAIASKGTIPKCSFCNKIFLSIWVGYQVNKFKCHHLYKYGPLVENLRTYPNIMIAGELAKLFANGWSAVKLPYHWGINDTQAGSQQSVSLQCRTRRHKNYLISNSLL